MAVFVSRNESSDRLLVSLPQIGSERNKKSPGGDLFSHTLASAVSSALRRFTSVFEMGTGGSASLRPPGDVFSRDTR